MADNIQIIDANTMFGLHPTHRLDMSVDHLVREMDKHRIAAGLTLSATGIFHNYVRGNARTLEAAKANNRLLPVATVNPGMYFGAAADMQALRSQGFRIAKFFPTEQGWTLDSAVFAEVLTQLAPTKMAIMVNTDHAGEPTTVGRMVSGYPAPVILCGISLNLLSEALAVAAKLPNVMIETHELHVPGALGLIAERIAADRIIFGSGAPRSSIASSLHYVLNADLSDDDKKAILAGNIRRILEAQ